MRPTSGAAGRSRRPPALIIMAIAAWLALTALAAVQPANDDETLVLFWGDGCPHCSAERQFLDEASDTFPALSVVEYEVWRNEDNRQLFESVMAERGLEPRVVPTTILGDRVWEGFSAQVEAEIRAELEILYGVSTADRDDSDSETSFVRVPLVGDVNVGDANLLLATLVIGFVDGFNPCSLWVLSILLALVLRSGSRRRVLAVGSSFLLVTTLLYGLFIAGVFGALSAVAFLPWVRGVMAAIALAFGLVNLWDYWRGTDFLLSISEARKPGIYRAVRTIAAPDQPLPAALTTTAGLAVGVSLLETPCTAGYPLLWSSLLTEAGVGWTGAAALFGVYMLVFLIDELAVFGVAVVTLRAAKMTAGTGRLLKLVSGALMTVLAGVLVFAPEAMNSVASALWVMAGAAGISVVGWIVDRLRRPSDPTRQGSGRTPTTVH